MAPGISQRARIVAAVLPDSFQVAVHENIWKNINENIYWNFFRKGFNNILKIL